MNSVLLLTIASIVIPTILCVEPHFANQELEAISNRIRNRQRSETQNCVYLLYLPLLTMFFGQKDDFNQVCSTPLTYFQECDSLFPSQCRAMNCDLSTMKPWVEAFPTAADSYLCKFLGYDAVNATFQNIDKNCMMKVMARLESDMVELHETIWTGLSVNCSYMDAVMNGLVDDFNNCSDAGMKAMRHEAVNYLNAVVGNSPCKGKFTVGAAARSAAASFVLAIFSLAIASMATILH